jgi:hypothetical protein
MEQLINTLLGIGPNAGISDFKFPLADGKILIVEITVNHNVLSNRIA